MDKSDTDGVKPPVKTPATQAERELLESLENAIDQACTYDGSGVLDSRALTYFSDAMFLLEEYGVLKIEEHHGRRVIARKVVKE